MAVQTNPVRTAIAGPAVQADLFRRPLKAAVLGNSFSVPLGGNWFYELCSYSAGHFELHYAGGVAGNTTAQMLARVSDIPATANICLVLEGSNDASNAVTAPTHAANLLGICQALQSRGILPVLCMSPPKDASGTLIGQYRLAEYQLARKYGFLLFDPFGAYFDSASTTGNWSAGASPDGTHPSLTVYRDAGRALIDQLRGSSIFTPLQPKNNGWGGMATNNLFGASAAGLATAWNKIGTPTTTIAAGAGDGILGNWQTASVAGGTGSQGVYQDLALPAGSLDSDEYLVRCAFKATVTSGSPGLYLFVRWLNGGGSGIRDDYFVYNTVSPTTMPRYWQQVLTPPTGTASAKLFLQMSLGTAYSADISIGEVVVANLTRLAGF